MRNDYGIAHAAVGLQRGFDVTELYPETLDLDLEVLRAP